MSPRMAPHTAQTSGSSGFDTGRLTLGQKKAVIIDKPGTYDYFCIYHRFMVGKVVVK